MFADTIDLTNILSAYEAISLIIISAIGLALILLSRLETKNGDPTRGGDAETVHAPDMQSARIRVVVPCDFQTGADRFYKKVRSAHLRDYMNMFSGANPEHAWLISIDGINFELNIGINPGIHLKCCSVDEYIPFNDKSSWTRPKFELTLVDQKGRTLDIDISPVGVFKPDITVSIENHLVRCLY